MDSMPTMGMLSTYHKMSPLLISCCCDYPLNWISLLSKREEFLTLIKTLCQPNCITIAGSQQVPYRGKGLVGEKFGEFGELSVIRQTKIIQVSTYN